MMRLVSRAPIPALFTVAFVWGASFPATQRLLDDLSTRQALFARFALAWALMALADRCGRGMKGAPPGLTGLDTPIVATIPSGPTASGNLTVRGVAAGWGPPIASGALLLVVFWMEIEALSLTTVSSVAVLLAATTVVTAIVERMTGATRLSAMTVIAGGAVIVGTLLMSAGPRGFGLGEALALGSNVPRALQMAISRRIVHPADAGDRVAKREQLLEGSATSWRQRAARLLRSGPQRTPAALTQFQFLVVAIGACALIFADGDVPTVPHTFGGWAVLVFLTTACTIGAFATITAALVHVSASIATLVLSTEPVWGAVFGVVLLGERLGLAGTIGAALIVSSAVLGSVGQQNA